MQLSAFPDTAPDKPVGPLIGSVQTGSNADLIATVAPLYLTGTVCDVTYGLGGWWRRYRPDNLTAHDLDPTKGDGIDFRDLPEPDNTYDAVTYDPPYIPQGGTQHAPEFVDRFGLNGGYNRDELHELMRAGLAECVRVSRQWVLMKCTDYTNGGVLNMDHALVIAWAHQLDVAVHDLFIHHTGSGPGAQHPVQHRARRHHSYLIVFDVRNGKSPGNTLTGAQPGD